jgi:hypothetical protein
MPYIDGHLYPEIDSAGSASKQLRVLLHLNGQLPVEWLRQFRLITEYLNSIPRNDISISTFYDATRISNEAKALLDADQESGNEGKWSLQDCIKAADKLDCDFVITNYECIWDECDTDQASKERLLTFEQSLKVFEIFVKGHEIPWSFEQPVWNMPWGSFHSLCDVKGRVCYGMLSKLTQCNLAPEVVEYARSLLLNRFAHVCYTRDKIAFYDMQRRFAVRRKWERQQFFFEIGFYLTNYYLALWGCVDQLSLFVNRAFGLGVQSPNQISFRNKKFIRKLVEKSPEVAGIVNANDFSKWLDDLMLFRDHCAHRGTMELAIILHEPTDPLDEREIEAEAEASPFWSEMKTMLSSEMFDTYAQSVKNRIRLSKYRKETSDASIFNSSDCGSRTIFYPVARLDSDFEMGFRLITEILEKATSRFAPLSQG